MRRWIRGAATALGIAAIALTLAAYWLFYDNRLPGDGRFALDLSTLR